MIFFILIFFIVNQILSFKSNLIYIGIVFYLVATSLFQDISVSFLILSVYTDNIIELVIGLLHIHVLVLNLFCQRGDLKFCMK